MKHLFILSFLIISFFSFAQDIIPKDSIYFDEIRSVQFYQNFGNNNPQDVINTPVLELGKASYLTLEFDVLSEDINNFVIQIYAYNHNWKKLSMLLETDYLEEYNEFNVINIEPSFNTKLPYTHYSVDLPTILKNGNFLVAVLDESEKVILTKRFMVYSPKSSVSVSNQFSQNGLLQSRQTFNFDVNFHVELLNPMERVFVIIRQNGHWNHVKKFTKPTFLQTDKMQYRLFRNQDAFNAGNEFRLFDGRSIRFKGFRVEQIIDSTKFNSIFLREDTVRHHTYFTYDDVNGQYLVDHYELGEGRINSDYLFTHFTLKAPKSDQPIYIYGALSHWQLKEEFKMRYDEKEEKYHANPLLKQGYYNYQYVTLDENSMISPQKIEGSHFQTENDYEIFIYYTNLSNIDELIGYKQFKINP